MLKALKLYDLIMGFVLGIGATLLTLGHRDAALLTAVVALGLRFTVGRAALRPSTAVAGKRSRA